eukprot:Gb_33707 [translate_table: standard]
MILNTTPDVLYLPLVFGLEALQILLPLKLPMAGYMSSIYGRLTGVGRNTLKSDIIHFFDSCGLRPEDIKIAYNRNYSPLGINYPRVLPYLFLFNSVDTLTRLIECMLAFSGCVGRSHSFGMNLTVYSSSIFLISLVGKGIWSYTSLIDISEYLSGWRFLSRWSSDLATVRPDPILNEYSSVSGSGMAAQSCYFRPRNKFLTP